MPCCRRLSKAAGATLSCATRFLNVRSGGANLRWDFFSKNESVSLPEAGRRRITAPIVTVAEWPPRPSRLAQFAPLLPSVPQQCFPINKLIFLWIASPSLAHDQSAVEVAVISFFVGKRIRLRSERKLTLFLQRLWDELKALSQSAPAPKCMQIYWHLEEEKHNFVAALRLWTLFQRTLQLLAAVKKIGEN